MTAPAKFDMTTVTEGHYVIRKQKFVRVTSLIAAVGLSDFSSIPARDRDYYMQRGKGTHRLFEDVETGKADAFTYDPRVEVYKAAHAKFLRETGFTAAPSGIEHRVFATWKELGLQGDDESEGLAGTLDRFGLMQMRPALCDYKTSSLPPAVRKGLPTPTAVQTSLYAILLCIRQPMHSFGVIQRFGVAFKANGNYVMSPAYSFSDKAFAMDAIRKYLRKETI